MRRPSAGPLWLPLLLAAAAVLEPARGEKAACPTTMTCSNYVKGFFSDPPRGHLKLAYTNKGPHLPESCEHLCSTTDGCHFWMYNMLRPDGECKMWSKEQTPCEAVDPADPASTFFDTMPIGFTVVGGACVRVDERMGVVQPQHPAEAAVAPYTKSKCPLLRCNSPHRGFLYDHPSKGHLLDFATGRPRKAHSCFLQCMETPGCAFWMFDIKSEHGDCVLWTEDQNPCAPEEGGDEESAHFDGNPTHGKFVVGGYCKMGGRSDTDVLD